MLVLTLQIPEVCYFPAHRLSSLVIKKPLTVTARFHSTPGSICDAFISDFSTKLQEEIQSDKATRPLNCSLYSVMMNI